MAPLRPTYRDAVHYHNTVYSRLFRQVEPTQGKSSVRMNLPARTLLPGLDQGGIVDILGIDIEGVLDVDMDVEGTIAELPVEKGG